MTGRQDDTGPIAGPDSPADDLEKKRAERFGELIDSVVGDGKLPPAMDPDDRMLVDVASMIQASTREVSLDPERARLLTEQALERAANTSRPPSISSLPAVSDQPEDELGARRSRLGRMAPWTVAALAAAAAIALWIARPPAGGTVAGDSQTAPPAKELAESQRSRPTDSLVGVIPRTDSHLASSRIDVIYADRLDGYRSLALSARAPRGARRD